MNKPQIELPMFYTDMWDLGKFINNNRKYTKQKQIVPQQASDQDEKDERKFCC